MLTTRCPHCNTVFRVRSEQLGQRNGRVRCGKCHTPFSALETLAEQPDGTPLNPPASPASPAITAPASVAAPVESPAIEAAPPVQAAPAEPPALAEPPAAPEPIAPAIPPSSGLAETVTLDQARLPEPPSLASADLEPPAPAGDFHIDFDFGNFGEDLSPASSDTRSTQASIAQIDEANDAPFVNTQIFAATPGAEATAGTEAPPQAPLTAEAEPAAGTASPAPANNDVASLIESAAEEIRLQGLEDGFTEAAPDTEVVQALMGQAEPPEGSAHEGETVFLEDEFIPPPKKRRGRKVLWTLIALLLLAAALGQAAYVFRTQLAQLYPELRAPLEKACSYVDCTVPYPRNPAVIKVQSSDLVPEPNQPGQYRLIATLLNLASYPQAWPHLELTLLDRYERALSRRVLSPAEWLPYASREQAAFEARGEITANIALGSDLPADGYRVYAFYP